MLERALMIACCVLGIVVSLILSITNAKLAPSLVIVSATAGFAAGVWVKTK